MNCVVDGCNNYKRFIFPKDPNLLQKWLDAINKPHYQPKKWNGLCINHFRSEDYECNFSHLPGHISRDRIYLKKGAVPTIFSWSKVGDSLQDVSNLNDSHPQNNLQESFYNVAQSVVELEKSGFFDSNVSVHEEIISSDSSKVSRTTSVPEVEKENQTKKSKNVNHEFPSNASKGTSKKKSPRYNIEELRDNPDIILEFTGLENYEKFLTVFYSLGKRVSTVKIQGNKSHGNLSRQNQLFLTLWKLRKGCTDKELSIHFNIPKTAARNIFKSWVSFMAKQWGKINTWPSKDLVNYYMPKSFKQEFPDTRAIMDGTEIHIQRSKNPAVQQSTFSHYKNDTTLKVVVMNSPGGLFTYCTELYGGSTSDRQVIERSGIQFLCEPKDMIMADKGFTVQDIFAPYGVAIGIPTFKKKGHIPLKQLLADRKLSKYRIHVERIIGLLKTYKILSTKLNHYYVPIANEITKVCVMMCNFKECIMIKKKK